jgi:plastocyanin
MRLPATLASGIMAAAVLGTTLIVSYGGASAATTTVEVGDIYFCDASYQGSVCTTTISAGDTVVWDFGSADISHTVTECGSDCNRPTSSPVFDSGIVSGGSSRTYQFTFTSAGTYKYHCQIHPLDQKGEIVVQAAPGATSTPSGNGTPGFSATPVSTSATGGLPPTGYTRQDHAPSPWWVLGSLVTLGVTLIVSGTLSYARRR